MQLTLNYHTGVPPTNATATPEMRNVVVRHVQLHVKEKWLQCDGLSDSIIEDVKFDDVTVTGPSDKGKKWEVCTQCKISTAGGCSPVPKCRGSSAQLTFL